MIKYIQLFAILFILCSQVMGAELGTEVPRPEIVAKQIQTPKGLAIQLTVTLAENWHITSHNPTDEFAFGAEVAFKNSKFETGKIVWPQPIVKFIKSIGVENSFYEGTFQILIPLNSSPTKIQGQEVVLHYQSCTQKLCLAPDYATTIIW